MLYLAWKYFVLLQLLLNLSCWLIMNSLWTSMVWNDLFHVRLKFHECITATSLFCWNLVFFCMKAVKPMDTIMNENIRNGIKQPLIVAPGQRGNISQVFVVVEAWRLKFSGASFQRWIISLKYISSWTSSMPHQLNTSCITSTNSWWTFLTICQSAALCLIWWLIASDSCMWNTSPLFLLKLQHYIQGFIMTILVDSAVSAALCLIWWLIVSDCDQGQRWFSTAFSCMLLGVWI